jgi:hypothetical protein
MYELFWVKIAQIFWTPLSYIEKSNIDLKDYPKKCGQCTTTNWPAFVPRVILSVQC